MTAAGEQDWAFYPHTNQGVLAAAVRHGLGLHGVTSDRHFRKTATEYDGKPGIKRLSGTAK
jgi:hypothetical protein